MGRSLGAIAVGQAVLFAGSLTANGFYDFSTWGVVSMGSFAVLIAVLVARRPMLGRPAIAALTGLGLIVALSAASLLWAESVDAAWTEVNRLAFYAASLAIVVLTVDRPLHARGVVLVLGAGALMVATVVNVQMLVGDGAGLFLQHRLNEPLGYVNGVAGFLVMGLWPWLGVAMIPRREAVRAAAIGAAALVGSTIVLTQSRGILLGAAVAAALVFACTPHRTRLLGALASTCIGVAVALPWTLDVYESALGRLNESPADSVLGRAALAAVGGAIVAAACHVTGSALAHRTSQSTRRRLRRIAPAAAALSLTLAVGGVLAAGGPWIERQYDAFVQQRDDASVPVRFVAAGGYRYDLWRVAVDEFRDHPVNGLGAGNYDTEYYARRANPQPVRQPHSLELQLLAELGMGGGIGIVLFAGAVLWGMWRAGRGDDADPLVLVGAGGLFVAWLATTSVDWLHNIPGLTAMAMASAGLLVRPIRPASFAPRHAGVWRSATAACVIVLALLAASTGRQLGARHYRDDARAQLRAGDARGALRTLARSRRLNPADLATRYLEAAANARLGDASSARSVLIATTRREPHNPVPWTLLGDLEVRRGDFPAARAAYLQAHRLNPRDAAIAALAADPRGALALR